MDEIDQPLQDATDEIIQIEGILMKEFCMWSAKKFAAYSGTLYLTPKRLAFHKVGGMGSLIGMLIGRKTFTRDIPIVDIRGAHRTNFGKAKQIVIEYGDDQKFIFATNKKTYEQWISVLTQLGVAFET